MDGGGLVEKVVILGGLPLMQVACGGYMVFQSCILSGGFDPLLYVALSNFAVSVFLAPFAVAFERKQWPEKISRKMWLSFLFLSLGGVALFNPLVLIGMKKTSPEVSSAMLNILPGVIFIISACVRLEKVDIKCKYSRSKIIGTVICLLGASMMSFMQTSSTISQTNLTSLRHSSWKNIHLYQPAQKDWIIGCFSLFAAVLVMSCCMILMTPTMREFPAPISLCSIACFLGSMFVVVVIQVIGEGRSDDGFSLANIGLVGVVAGVNGSTTAFQTWSIQKRGPFFVNMFNPIASISTTILTALISKRYISWGSLIGMVIVFGGLYIVLWAKNKEYIIEANEAIVIQRDDIEKPLLR